MKTSFTLLGAATIAVRIVLVHAAPVIITTTPQLSLDGLTTAAGDAIYPRSQGHLHVRTDVFALDEALGAVVERIASPSTFHSEAGLTNDIRNEAHEMRAPVGMLKAPQVHHGSQREELVPFHATPAAEPARQVPEKLKATEFTLEAQPDLKLTPAPQRQVSHKDSTSLPSSPAHLGDDDRKHHLLDALLSKHLSVEEPVSLSSTPPHQGGVQSQRGTSSHATRAHGETSHGEVTPKVKADHNADDNADELPRNGFTEKEEREIDALRKLRRQLDEANFKLEETGTTIASMLKGEHAVAEEVKLAATHWGRVLTHIQVLNSGMSSAQIKAAGKREEFWRQYWSNRLKGHKDIDPDYLRIYSRREHPMHMLLFAHTYRASQTQSREAKSVKHYQGRKLKLS